MLINSSRSSVLRALRWVHALYGALFSVVLAGLLVNAFVLTGFTVDGHSMDPTLHNRDRLAVSLAAYWFSEPQLGDVVIVAYDGDNSVRFVKRIAGVPGDLVTVGDAKVTVEPGHYYVLGDNRMHSTDSRAYGTVGREQIIGKVIFPAISR